MPRVGLDEAVGGGDGGVRLVVLVLAVNGVDLGLLGITAERIAGLDLVQILDGGLVVARTHGVLGFAIELLDRPALGFVDLFRQQRAAGQQRGHERTGKKQF